MGERSGYRSIGERLWDLEQRLARVEARVGLVEPMVELEEETALRGEDPTPLVTAPPAVQTPMMPAAPSPMPPPLPVVRPQRWQEPAPATVDYAPPPEAEPVRQTQLEQTIGLKWAGWVGAVVVVIGAALGIKFAYDQGWFEILPPAGRLALMSLGGFGLIAAGEYVFRRIHQLAAACLFGAGVATLFLVSYAGHGYYRLYEPQTAFVLMGLTTVVGAAVAVRGNLLSIAVLSQIGGNLAPVLLHSDRPMIGSFLAYLLTLQLVSVVLAWSAGPGRWWALRIMSLATTSLWVAALITNPRVDAAGTLVTYSLLFAALYQAELILSATRRRAEGLPEGASDPLAMSLSASSSPSALAAIFSVAVTALLTASVLGVLHDAGHATRGAWVLGLAGACATLGVVLSRSHAKDHPVHKLAIAFRVQAAALVVAAVPVALSGAWIVFGWAVLSLTFAALGNRLNLRISRWAGVMVWRLAVLYLAGWALKPFAENLGGPLLDTDAHAVWLTLLGHDVRAYTVLAWMLAAVGHAVAWLIARTPVGATQPVAKSDRLARVTHGMAGFVWFAASVAGLPPAGATLAVLVYAWLLLGADMLDPRIGLALQSAVMVGLVTVKWLAVDTLAERLAPGWSPLARRPVFNAVMGVGTLISATMGALYWLRREVLWESLTARRGVARDGQSAAAPALGLAAVLTTLFAVAFTVEIDRIVEAAAQAGPTLWPLWQLNMMAWTVLWMLCLCGYLALSRRLEPDDALRPGWVKGAEILAVLVAVKFLLVDTLLYRAFAGVVLSTPLVNFQTLTGAVVAGGMVLVGYLLTRGPTDGASSSRRRGIFAVAGFLAILVVLWGGTLELDRFFERMLVAGSTVFTDPRLAKQVAFSIFWSVFAVSAVLAGFRFRTPGLRYFGLGLFAITLLKVVLLDMSQVQTGYRVLSFLGLGLLLMGTSVLYGKLSPLLLRRQQEEAAGMIGHADAPPTV